MRSTGVFSWPSCGFTLPSCKGLVVLSKVFVVRYYRVVCPYYWRSTQYGLEHFSTTQYSAVQYITVQCSAVKYSTVIQIE